MSSHVCSAVTCTQRTATLPQLHYCLGKLQGQFCCTIQYWMVISLCCTNCAALLCSAWWDMYSLGTYCLSVTHYLVLTPLQTQRCQYCFYTALSSQGLILYFTVVEKKTHFLHQNVSCFCLTQTAPCLAVQFTCPIAVRAVVSLRFDRAQRTVHWEDRPLKMLCCWYTTSWQWGRIQMMVFHVWLYAAVFAHKAFLRDLGDSGSYVMKHEASEPSPPCTK